MQHDQLHFMKFQKTVIQLLFIYCTLNISESYLSEDLSYNFSAADVARINNGNKQQLRQRSNRNNRYEDDDYDKLRAPQRPLSYIYRPLMRNLWS